jgi:hypothetical protein
VTPGSGGGQFLDAGNVQTPDQVTDGGHATATDPDAERRALADARSRRRMVKNLILGSICAALLIATLWVLLVVGPL